jgi:metal transporter CNNM
LFARHQKEVTDTPTILNRHSYTTHYTIKKDRLSSSPTMTASYSSSEILAAAELLRNIGASVCHPYDLGDDSDSGLPLCHHSRNLETFETPTFDNAHDETIFYVWNIGGAILMIMFVSLISGLFLGMLTLDALDLLIIMRASRDEDERKYAAALHPIVKQRHLLLVTLLILNALAYETLPLFLDAMVPAWVTIILSTTLILTFGEIIPSAIFTGPMQLYLGYHMVPLVKVFLIIMYPFAKPLSSILDAIVFPDGQNDSEESYNRGELSALVNIQYEQLQKVKHKHKSGGHKPGGPTFQKMGAIQTAFHQTNLALAKGDTWSALKQELLEAVNERESTRVGANLNDDDGAAMELELQPPLEKQEVDLVVGALQMKTKVVMDVFTPLRLLYSVPDDLVLDRRGLTDIYAKGYSRVPVYHQTENEVEDDDDSEKSVVWGYLLTRQLIMIDWDHEREVSTLPIERPTAISPRMNLVQALKLLKAGGSLMAFVCARPDVANRALSLEKPIPSEGGFMGIITLEDIMVSILQDRIYDEWDIRDRDRAVNTLTRWAAGKLQAFARKRLKEIKEKKRQLELEQKRNDSSSSLPEYTHEASESGPLDPAYQSASDLGAGATDLTPLLSGNSNRGSYSYSTNGGGEIV